MPWKHTLNSIQRDNWALPIWVLYTIDIYIQVRVLLPSCKSCSLLCVWERGWACESDPYILLELPHSLRSFRSLIQSHLIYIYIYINIYIYAISSIGSMSCQSGLISSFRSISSQISSWSSITLRSDGYHLIDLSSIFIRSINDPRAQIQSI